MAVFSQLDVKIIRQISYNQILISEMEPLFSVITKNSFGENSQQEKHDS